MKVVCVLAVLGCLLFVSTARVGDVEGVPLDKLPQVVVDAVNRSFARIELLHAWKEVEKGKECYVVRILGNDRPYDLYVSPDGQLVAQRQEAFSLERVSERLTVCVLVVLLPGVIAGAFARWLARAIAGGDGPSVLTEWLSAWLGAWVIIGLLWSNPAAVPHYQDLVGLGTQFAVWGVLSASIVELLGLTVQGGRGSRTVRSRWILGLCLAAFVSLGLTIAFDVLRVEVENQHSREQAMKPPAG